MLNNNQEDISDFIERLQRDITKLQMELVAIRIAQVAPEEKEKHDAEIKTKTELLSDLEKDLQRIVKTQSTIMRYEKLSGKKNSNNGTKPHKGLNLKNNVGSIVAEVPRN